jgi:transcription-repair coupling factor (superfamily II helicase)
VRIDLPVDAYLPGSYIDREPLRLAAYRRIAETVSMTDVDEVADELRDRFGPLPKPAGELLAVARLRAELREVGVTDVSGAPHELYGRVVRLRPVPLDAAARGDLRDRSPRAVWTESTETLLLPVPDSKELDLVEWLRERVRELPLRDKVRAV